MKKGSQKHKYESTMFSKDKVCAKESQPSYKL